MSTITPKNDRVHELYVGLEGLQQLKDDWVTLLHNVQQPAYFQDWRWMYAVVKWLITDPVIFLTVKKSGRTVLILTLQASSVLKAGIRHKVLRFPTHNHVRLTDVVCDMEAVDQDDLKSAFSYLSKHHPFAWRFLELRGINANSQIRKLIEMSGESLDEQSTNAYFKVEDSKFDQGLSKKFLKNIERLAKKAEKEVGEIKVSFNRNREDLAKYLDVFFEVEASGWKGEGGTATAIKQHPELVSFYKEVMDLFSEDDSFAINLLYCGDKPAAAQLCIRRQNVWYILKIGYIDSMKKYGPGNILMLRFLTEVSQDQAIQEVNLVTSPDWASRWHLELRPVYGYRHFNTDLKGYVSKLIFYAGSKVKSFTT